MPFNAEIVARAIAACPVPVVTGIGHEPDNSIADMVADLRASTPTAAAEAVAPSLTELAAVTTRERRALGRALDNRVQSAWQRVARLAERPVLRDPHAVLGIVEQALDLRAQRLMHVLPERISRDEQRVVYVRDRLRRAGVRLTEGSAVKVGVSAARLESLSPLAILSRGYAVCLAEDGHTIVKHVADVQPRDRVSVRVSDGHIRAEVSSTATLEER